MNLIGLIHFLVFSIIFHASGLSESHYYLKENHIIQKFEMDENELKQYRIGIECKKDIMSQLCNAQYVISNSSLEINGALVIFELNSSSKRNGHITLLLKSKKNYSKIDKVKIINNCFYELNPEFKNRARLNFRNIEKSFLLTKVNNSVLTLS